MCGVRDTVVLAALLSLVGCASEGPPPTEELAKAQAMVQQADKADAQRHAGADMQRAHEELQAAEQLNGEHKYDAARRSARAASADANLALAQSGAAEAQASAQELEKSNQTLRQEATRREEPK
jgi:predicted small lipoprotein YifL